MVFVRLLLSLGALPLNGTCLKTGHSVLGGIPHLGDVEHYGGVGGRFAWIVFGC